MNPLFRTTTDGPEAMQTREVAIPTTDPADPLQVDATWTPDAGALVHVGAHAPLTLPHAAARAAQLSALIAAAMNDLPHAGAPAPTN